MTNLNQAPETDAGMTQSFVARAIASGVPLAAAVYVASGHIWIGAAAAVLVAIAGALVRALRKNASRTLRAE